MISIVGTEEGRGREVAFVMEGLGSNDGAESHARESDYLRRN